MYSKVGAFGLVLLLAYFESTQATSEEELLTSFVQPALSKVNELRKKYKLNPLRLDSKLTTGSQSWAETEARNGRLEHSCGPCDNYSELLAEKITNGPVPAGQAAVDWALNRWFASLITDQEPKTDAQMAYANLLKKPNLVTFGIGIAYGRTPRGEKTVFAVARFTRASRRNKSG